MNGLNKILRRIISFSLVTVMAFSLCACTGDGGDVNPSPTFSNGMDVNNDSDYTDLFNKGEVIPVSVTINETYYNEILAYPENEQFYSADIVFGTETVYNIGFRTTGNTSLGEGRDEAQSRYSYKVKFDKYVDKQKLLKLDELVFINFYKDPSFMREYLTIQAFNALNGYAPLSTFVELKINGVSKGLYLCVESIEDGYLNRVFGNNNGNLYKADEGTTLLDTNSLATLDQKNGKDSSKTDLTDLINKLNAMEYGTKGDIESILDVDSVLKYIAVNAVLGNFSSYLGDKCENYYLAVNGGKFYIIPWDFNLSFGGSGSDNGTSATMDPSEPVFEVSISERPLVDKILAVDEYKTKYLDYVSQVVKFLQGIDTLISSVNNLIGNYIQSDNETFYSYEDYLVSTGLSEGINTSGIITLREYINRRVEFLVENGFSS